MTNKNTTITVEEKEELLKLINILETKFASSKGFMGVEVDTAASVWHLIQNVMDEIVSTEICIDGGYEEDLYGMTFPEARGYVKKLKRFVKTYE